MSRTTAWMLHLAVLVMALTGCLLIWLVYFPPTPADGDPELLLAAQDPWQPWLSAVHVVAAPVLVFWVGLIWFTHVYGRIRLGFEDRRAGGVFLAWLLPPLVLAGYLLQVVESEQARQLLGWGHAAAGVLFAVVYLVHVFRSGPQPAPTPPNRS